MIQKAQLPIRPSCLEKYEEVTLCFIPGYEKEPNTFIYVKRINGLTTDDYHPCDYERKHGIPALRNEWDKTSKNKSLVVRLLSDDEIECVYRAIEDRKDFLELSATQRSSEVKQTLESLQTFSGGYNPFAGLDKILEKKDT